MIVRHESATLTWYDVRSPSPSEVRELVTTGVVPLAFSADLSAVTPQVEARSERGAVKLILNWPVVKRPDMTRPHHVKFIATKKALVTVRFEDMQVLEQFAKDFEVVTILKKAQPNVTGGTVLILLLERFYRSLDDKLDFLLSRLEDIDDEVFHGHEREMVRDIAEVGRRVIQFRQAIESHENPLDNLYQAMEDAFGKSHKEHIIHLNERYLHVCRRMSRLTLALQELRETNNSLITTKQNEIMKTLTIMAFVTFPLTLVSSIFGMNTISTPIIGYAHDFWVIIGFMSLGFIAFFIYFRHKNWL